MSLTSSLQGANQGNVRLKALVHQHRHWAVCCNTGANKMPGEAVGCLVHLGICEAAASGAVNEAGGLRRLSRLTLKVLVNTQCGLWPSRVVECVQYQLLLLGCHQADFAELDVWL
jgi:hypothetical protein